MISAATIKIPHKLKTGETVVMEHFLVALMVKPKKLGVTVYAQTLCGWAGPIKESEFKLHYRYSSAISVPTVNCGACHAAAFSEPQDPTTS